MFNSYALIFLYRVILVVSKLGWVDLDLICSTILLGQQVLATVAAHRCGELPDPKSTQTCCQTTRITL